MCGQGWTPWLGKDCAYIALTWSLHYIHLDLFIWHFRYIHLLKILAASSAGLRRSEGNMFLFLKRGVEKSMQNRSVANHNKPWACSDASSALTGATRVASLHVWLTPPGEAIGKSCLVENEDKKKLGEGAELGSESRILLRGYIGEQKLQNGPCHCTPPLPHPRMSVLLLMEVAAHCHTHWLSIALLYLHPIPLPDIYLLKKKI